MNALRQKLEKRERIWGTLVCLSDPCLCEIFGRVGFDCLWIDTEHTHLDYKDVLCHLNAAKATSTPALVRLPQNDPTATKKILEMGPDGVLFPMVRSAKEARELLAMTLYPPLGTRGFGPLRAIGYGAESAKEYAGRTSLEMCRFLQIEHIDMIEELDEIAALPFVDGFIFGPNDLSGSLGDFLNVFGEKTLSQMKRAVEILKAHGKPFGIAGGMDEKSIQTWSEWEPDMLFVGADWSFLFEQGKSTLNTMIKHKRSV